MTFFQIDTSQGFVCIIFTIHWCLGVKWEWEGSRVKKKTKKKKKFKMSNFFFPPPGGISFKKKNFFFKKFPPACEKKN